MALTNPYCQVADIRDQLGDSGGKISEALLERAINATSRSIEKYCGERRFWQDPTPTSRLYRPVDRDVLDVDDISSREGLVVTSGPDSSGTFTTTWQDSDFQLEPLNADASGDSFAWTMIRAVGAIRFGPFSARASVQVTAKFGWSSIPDDVKEACIIKAVSLFHRKDAPFGIAGVNDFGPVRISRNDPDVVDLLNPFRRTGVA